MTSYKLSPEHGDQLKDLMDWVIELDPTKKGFKERQEKAKWTERADWLGVGVKAAVNYFRATGEGKRQNPWTRRSFNSFCKRFDMEAKNANKQIRQKYEQWKQELTEIYNQPTIKRKANAASSKKVVINHGADSFLKVLEGTYWYCYEAEGDVIRQKVIHFTGATPGKNGCLDFTYTFNDGDGQVKFEGDMRFIDADSLLVGICRNMSTSGLIDWENKPHDERAEVHYTHFAFPIKNKSEQLTLCIGHKTFYNSEQGNVVTKSVILEKVLQIIPEPIPGKYDPKQKMINEDIRKYLSDRKLNRISTPHQVQVYNEKKLTAFFRRQSQMNDRKYRVDRTIIGVYDFIYCLFVDPHKGNVPIIKRKFEIIQLPDGLFQGKYTELVQVAENNETKEEEHDWTGLIYENADTDTLNMVLNGPYLKGKLLPVSTPLFILLYVSTKKACKIDTVTGIAMHIREPNAGPVARLILLTKQEKYDTKLIEDFFVKFKEGARVRPPNDRIAMQFSDIIAIVK